MLSHDVATNTFPKSCCQATLTLHDNNNNKFFVVVTFIAYNSSRPPRIRMEYAMKMLFHTYIVDPSKKLLYEVRDS